MSGGILSEVSLSQANDGGNGIAVGHDGKLWVAQYYAGSIARLSAIGGTGQSITATHGVGFTKGVAVFVDGTPRAAAADFTATINWGDHTLATSGTVGGSTGGPFTVSGTHTYAKAGTYKTTVTLGDNVDHATYSARPGDAVVN
jgi:hypothetical protein